MFVCDWIHEYKNLVFFTSFLLLRFFITYSIKNRKKRIPIVIHEISSSRICTKNEEVIVVIQEREKEKSVLNECVTIEFLLPHFLL